MSKWLPSRIVCERLGISDRTLDRWIAVPELGFPPPKYVRKRRYWDEAALEAWRGRQVAN
jgi:predicted DNA-binding transcriptional regulator AlpA